MLLVFKNNKCNDVCHRYIKEPMCEVCGLRSARHLNMCFPYSAASTCYFNGMDQVPSTMLADGIELSNVFFRQ